MSDDKVVVEQKRTTLQLRPNRQQVFVLPRQVVAEIQRHRPQIITRGNNPQVQVQQQPKRMKIGGTGTQGPPGETEGATFLASAGETIHGLRAVRIVNDELFHPDTSVTAHGPQTIGVALQSGPIGTPLLVRTGGLIEEASWNWAAGYVWCGVDGQLTQSPPSTGWLLQMGRVTNPTTIEVDVDLLVIRS